MHADPEHEQDHAEFGEFRGEGLVGDKAGGEGADEHASQQIADEG